MVVLAQALREAIAKHRAGDLDSAEHGYEEILRVAPRHFDATHMLGVVEMQRGRFGRARRCR